MAHSYPIGVGPHELRELDLMLSGTKPAAMFGDAIQSRDILPEAAFAPHVAAGRIVKRAFYWTEPETGHSFIDVYYALPGEEWRIDALHALTLVVRNRSRPWTDEDEIEMGRLLGYTSEEIEAYLAWTKNRGPLEGK